MTNKFLHDPASVSPYNWDWSDWLDGETITAKTVTIPTGLTRDSAHPTDTEALGVVTAWITGGTPPTIYPVVCHITTSAGRQDDRTIWLTAINR